MGKKNLSTISIYSTTSVGLGQFVGNLHIQQDEDASTSNHARQHLRAGRRVISNGKNAAHNHTAHMHKSASCTSRRCNPIFGFISKYNNGIVEYCNGIMHVHLHMKIMHFFGLMRAFELVFIREYIPELPEHALSGSPSECSRSR